MTDTTTPPRRTTVTLIGGLRHRGRFDTGPQVMLVTAIGGMDIDLTEATIPADGLALTKVSLLGGVSLLVGPDVRVEVQSFALGGQDVERDAAADGPVVRVRSYGLLGGVKVRVKR